MTAGRERPDLLRHAAALRTLAQALLRDPQAAEDAVQDAFAQALDRPPERSLGGWLATVVRNFALQRRRGEARRVRREQAAAKPEAVVATDVAAMRRELLHRLVEAVHGLPEPYRDTVWARCFEELPPAAIAARDGVPVATVKSRLQRGLSLLRERLDGEQEARDWRAGMAMAFGIGNGVPAGAAAAAGVLLMGTAAKVAIGGGVLAAAAAVAWWAAGNPTVAPDAPQTAEPARPTAAVAEPGRPDAAPAASGSAAQAGPLDREPLTTATTGDVLLRCVWASDGAPVPWIGVWRYRVGSRGDLGPADAITCDEHGEAPLRSLPLGTFAFRAAGRERIEVTVEPGRKVEAELRIGEAAIVRGKVVDERNQPIGGAEVETCSHGLPHTAAETAADGTFQLRLASKGEIWAHKPRWQPSLLRVIAGSEDDVVLTLEGGGCGLTGSVLDPRGRPVAGASVTVAIDADGPSDRPRRAPVVLRTDAHGRFRAEEVPPGTHTVYAFTDGFAFAEAEVAIAADAPPPDVTLRLRNGATVHGRALDGEARDHPVAGLSLLIFRERDLGGLASGMSDRLVRRDALTDADGSYRFTAVPPGRMWIVAMVGTPKNVPVELVDGQDFEWNPDLAPPGSATIRGRLEGPDGAPLAGWKLRTQYVNLVTRVPESSSATTAADGSFELGKLRPQPYDVSACAPEAPYVPFAKRQAQPGGQDLVWRLANLPADCGAILGRIADPGGQPLDGAMLTARSDGGVSRQATVEQGCDGAFRIADLPPGTWQVTGYRKDYGRFDLGERRIAPRGEVDLGLHRLEPLGRALVRASGADVRGLELRLSGEGAVRNGTRAFEPLRDKMRSEPIPPGRYRLLFCGPGVAPGERLVEIRPGDDTDVAIEVAPAPTVALEFVPEGLGGGSWRDNLTVEVLDANGSKIVVCYFQVDGGSTFRWRVGLLPGAYTIEATSYQDVPRKGRATLIVPPSPAAPPAVTVRLAVQKE